MKSGPSITIFVATGVFLASCIFTTVVRPPTGGQKVLKGRSPVEHFRSLPLTEQIKALEKLSRNNSFKKIREFLGLVYPAEPKEKHNLTHWLGEFAVRESGLEGFGKCDSFLNYGCFHGAALAVVRQYGPGPRLGEKLWEGCSKAKALFPGQCLHGLGHALMIIKNYNSTEAYEECENLLPGSNKESRPNQDDAFWCMDGVAMENVTRSMAPKSLGSYGKYEDLYYPCNSALPKYEAVCARNHLLYLGNKVFWDLDKMMEFCLSFGADTTQRECTESMGSFSVRKFSGDHDGIVSQCRKAKNYFPSCINGGATALADQKIYAKAEELCSSLSGAENYFECTGLVQTLGGKSQ